PTANPCPHPAKTPARFRHFPWQFSLWISSVIIPALLAQTAAAQSVIDGLPPPPSIPDLDAPAPVPEEPANSLDLPPTNSALPYRVLVNSDSPFLLEQVRRIEPTAIFERYQGQSVILAGQFDQRALAQQQIDALAAQGIGAEIAVASETIATIGTGATAGDAVRSDAPSNPQLSASSNSDEFARPGSSIGTSAASSPLPLPPADLGQTPATPQTTITDPSLNSAAALVQTADPVEAPTPAQPTVRPSPIAQQRPSEPVSSDYYIVVPGDANALDRIQGQIALLGANPEAIAQRDEPLGPHLLVGPFVSRQSATRWNEFLRDFGMDARVYYRR
ncbi:MAG: hypothetical protein WBA10_01925, partial [Elainellaceae cyanobacterium]